MATAAMKARAGATANGGAMLAPEAASMEFLIGEDNIGDYHWTLLGRGGDILARSQGYASYQDAENAARVVLAGAGAARLDRRAADEAATTA